MSEFRKVDGKQYNPNSGEAGAELYGRTTGDVNVPIQVTADGKVVLDPTALDARFINDENDVIKDTHIDWGTGASQVSAADVPILDSESYYIGTNVETAFQDLGRIREFFNGSFDETFTALITSDGATITMNLQQSGGGDLTMNFSGGKTRLDCTDPVCTVVLTAGTDSSPQVNYVYIPQSTLSLTNSTSGWPATEHIKIAFALVGSATYVAADGAYINQNWNDVKEDTDSQGHMTHLGLRSRLFGAKYFSGVAPNGTDDSANSSYFDYVSGTEAYFKSTAGIVYQMHDHAVAAKDTRTDDIHVVNWNGDSYHDINDLTDITDDSTGSTLNNKFFNLTFWQVVNESGEYSPAMVNLPTGSYNTQSSAEGDVDGHDVLTMPREFSLDSSTGFLIARMTFKNTAGNWSHKSTVDLRGQTPSTAAGGASGVSTNFADNQFTIFNVSDITKIIDFSAASITTGNTRTITMADANVDLADIATNTTAIALNTTHRSSDGSDHSFIDQDLTSGSSPILDGTNFTGIPAAGILAGTFGSGDYVIDGELVINKTASFDAEFDNENSSTADTIDWGVGNKQRSTLTGDVTYTFTAPTGGASNFIFVTIQDVTGGRSITWPGTVEWPGGVAPAVSSGANDKDVWSFYYDGTNYHGAIEYNYG